LEFRIQTDKAGQKIGRLFSSSKLIAELISTMIILLMGITGSGKTTVGRMLAERLHWDFADADDFHTPANKEKMRQGIALSDADRGPWLAAIREQILRWIAANKNGVITCSALKQSYRDFLLSSDTGESAVSSEIEIVYLRGTYSLIAQRLHSRTGHFADERLLSSQLDTLEEPRDAVTIDIDKTPAQIVDETMRQLHLL
jgi:gluconokinase